MQKNDSKFSRLNSVTDFTENKCWLSFNFHSSCQVSPSCFLPASLTDQAQRRVSNEEKFHVMKDLKLLITSKCKQIIMKGNYMRNGRRMKLMFWKLCLYDGTYLIIRQQYFFLEFSLKLCLFTCKTDRISNFSSHLASLWFLAEVNVCWILSVNKGQPVDGATKGLAKFAISDIEDQWVDRWWSKSVCLNPRPYNFVYFDVVTEMIRRCIIRMNYE